MCILLLLRRANDFTISTSRALRALHVTVVSLDSALQVLHERLAVHYKIQQGQGWVKKYLTWKSHAEKWLYKVLKQCERLFILYNILIVCDKHCSLQFTILTNSSSLCPNSVRGLTRSEISMRADLVRHIYLVTLIPSIIKKRQVKPVREILDDIVPTLWYI